MVNQSNKHRLHSRIAMISIIIAIVATVFSVSMTLFVARKLEYSMIAVMVGHELNELIIELSENPDATMPRTSSVNAYLLSREAKFPIPHYLRQMKPNVYSSIEIDSKTLQATVVDIGNDRLFIEFDISGSSRYQFLLLAMLIGGGISAVIVLLVAGVWLSRRILLPVSDLAEEVSMLNPNDLETRIGRKYHGYEVGLIADSIDQFLERMNEFVEREQSFAAAVSHELRTPVAVIATATDLLELKGINDNQQGAVKRIKNSTNYMAKVIDALLFFARNTDDAFEKTLPKTNFHDVFPNILQQFEERASEKNLSLILQIDSEASVRMAESHLEIVLGNLIMNAIANTSVGEIKVIVKANGFSVEDTGHGIQADEIDLVVNRNYHNQDSIGHGLGLYLVVNICNIYNLKLDIDSTVGQGSKFTVCVSD